MAGSRRLTEYQAQIEEQAEILRIAGNDLQDWLYDTSNQSWSSAHSFIAEAEAAVRRLKELLAGKGG